MLPALHAIGGESSFCQQPGVFGMKRKSEAAESNYQVASWEAGENAAKRLRCFYDVPQAVSAYAQHDQCVPGEMQQMLHVDVTVHDIALHGGLEEKSDASNLACGHAFEAVIQEETALDLMEAEAASQDVPAANPDVAACSAMDSEGCPNPAQYTASARNETTSGWSHGADAGSGFVRRRGYCRPFWDGMLAPYPYCSDIY